MRSKTIPLIVFLVICVKTLNAYSFCQSFAENDFKISYTFNRLTESDPYLSYIFIGQKYWRFKYIDSYYDRDKRVQLLAEDGKLSNWFGSQYSSAFCTWFDGKCLVGLFSVCLVVWVLSLWMTFYSFEGKLHWKDIRRLEVHDSDSDVRQTWEQQRRTEPKRDRNYKALH